MTGENAVKTMQTRLSPGAACAGSTGCWRICISVLYTSRFYIQRKSNDKKMIYHSRPRAAFAQLTLTGRRLCAMPRLPPLPQGGLQKTATHVHDELN